MKKIGLFFAVLLLYAVPVFAEKQTTADVDPFHDWFAYYYMDKDPSKVPDFLKWLQESGVLEKHAGAIPAIEGFLSVLFTDNPSKTDGWSHAYAYTGKAREVMDYAAKPPVSPDKKEIKTSFDLDVMWGAFFATGNDIYIGKIVDVLDKSKPLTGDATKDAATRAAAGWSLGSNMTQHEAVDRFLQSESAKRTGAVGDELKRIVAGVVKQRDDRTLPFHEGEFSAAIVITDPEVAAKALGQPSKEVVHLQEMPLVKVGEKRTILIVFAGMQLASGYHADVTYDVKLVDPVGKTYSDLKDMEALKRRVPTRFRIFNNEKAVFLTFERKDKRGVYKVYVTLKDNIGKKTISLFSKITLKK